MTVVRMPSSGDRDSVLDALVVGAGPTGTMLALLLRRLGVACRVVERRTEPLRAPAAHAVNARTFEICRQAGVDMARIAAASQDPADAGATHWVAKLGGEVLGSLPYERQDDDVLAFTPTPLRNLSQHRFEPILHDALRAAGGDVEWGLRWVDAEQDAHGVTSRVVDASGVTTTVRSRFLVGADGAGSPVRKSLGIAQEGPERLQCFVMIHLAADLRPLVGEHRGVLYWVNDPDCSGVFVAHDLAREWVFMHPFDPDQEPAESFDAARCATLVRRAMVRDDVPFEIRTISPWTMTCQVAERYRDRRVLLAGDAAHRFPPTGGLGLNTGVQDAHNLAWKLAAVLRGVAPDSLLDTYESERRPVARYNAEQSLANAIKLFEVPQALGLGADPDESRRSFTAALADPDRRRAVAAAIANQAEHFDMLGLQLGYVYRDGALLDDGGDTDPPAANPVREYRPTSRPGARLPHGWIVAGGAPRSTLDLIALDRPTLLVGARSAEAWLAAARTLEPELRCVRVGADFEDPDGWWRGVAGMRDDGALLVRPDQHVAFRARGMVGEPARALRAALDAMYVRRAASEAVARA